MEPVDHSALALERIISALAEAPQWRSLVSALASRYQDVEDALYVLYQARHPDDAEGGALNLWGALLGEKRLARGDDIYRAAILARARYLRSHGTPEDILATARELLASRAMVRELYPPMARVQWTRGRADAGDVLMAAPGVWYVEPGRDYTRSELEKYGRLLADIMPVGTPLQVVDGGHEPLALGSIQGPPDVGAPLASIIDTSESGRLGGLIR